MVSEGQVPRQLENACPLCASSEVTEILVPYPLFRHLDFDLMSEGPCTLGQCEYCQLVFRIADKESLGAIDGIYESSAYANHQEPHQLSVAEFDQSVSLGFLQAELLANKITTPKPSILDIGCFDGGLLREFGVRFPGARLCGYDVSDRPQFNGGPGSEFVSGCLENVSGKFDLITFSHSLQYIRDLPDLFSKLKTLLNPQGLIFIHVPNFLVKPISLLLGDLHCHYSENILFNLFGLFGFKGQMLENNWFPRDILAIGRISPGSDDGVMRKDNTIISGIRYIDQIADNLDKLPKSTSRTGVLGTTIDAAFVGRHLGDGVDFFLDENPSKIGLTFQGKPVISFSEMGPDDMIIISMGASGKVIQKRLSSESDASFVCV